MNKIVKYRDKVYVSLERYNMLDDEKFRTGLLSFIIGMSIGVLLIYIQYNV